MPPSSPVRVRLLAAIVVTSAVLSFACGGPSSAALSDPVVAEDIVNVLGVPDRGLDPSTVSLTNARGDVCSAVLVASNVVLTARRCVTKEPAVGACGSLTTGTKSAAEKLATDDPGTFHVYTGSPSAGVPWASAGLAVFTAQDPVLCGADIAVLVLEWPLTGIPPALVSASGIPEGGHVRTVGFASTQTPDAGSYSAAVPWVSFEREHVPVLGVSASELAVGEATCFMTPGSPAYDEATGAIVGVLSRAGTACEAPAQFDVFTRADAFYELIAQALAWVPSGGNVGVDGGVSSPGDAGKKHDAGHAKKPASDVGAACLRAADCAAGVCVSVAQSQYCSRTCSPDDRCPTDFKCVIAESGLSVCTES